MLGMLVDHQIKALGLVSPLQDQLLQPASVDLTLGCNSATLQTVPEDPAASGGIYRAQERFHVGTTQPTYEYYKGWAEWILRPGELVLFETAETLTLPSTVAGKFEGKSSLGRLGLMTHITAGFIDPGYHGVLTLEVLNCGPLTLILRPGIRIGQASFTALEAIPSRSYGDQTLGSHYQGSSSVQGGKFDNIGGTDHEPASRD